MANDYADVITRFLRPEERLILSQEQEMPLVIEAKTEKNAQFLQSFLAANSSAILIDLATYGAVLLRGFAINSEQAFEQTILSIQHFKGISHAFMSEEGRDHVGDLNYVLHTNSVYKTGGTLYLGGFHSENYYSPDVPSYISFCCLKPSLRGGETGLINMAKIYQNLNQELKDKLETKNFFVSKWLLSEVEQRYKLPQQAIENICQQFGLPIIGEGKKRFILMYKPNVFEHPITQEKALQINLFELISLNYELRTCFMDDYQGKEWFWHRVAWRLPPMLLKTIEHIYLACASFLHSPSAAVKILLTKYQAYHAAQALPDFDQTRVGSCFNEQEIKELAQKMRAYYCSCLWQQGDILLIDNRKVAHAGMPGAGPRLIRAIICNPLAMTYQAHDSGLLHCKDKTDATIGYYMSSNL